MSTAPPTTARGVDFGILLNLAFSVFKSELHADLKSKGYDDLAPSFGYVLRTLEGTAMSLKDLAAALGITPQGTLKIVEEMVTRGYVRRAPDALDARVKRLELTDKSRALLKESRRFHAQFERKLASKFGQQQVTNARATLEAIVGASPAAPAARMQLL
jgi:DNA-binding MarR family transcriptional regulator